jgi:hypothetical protein
MEEIKLMNKLLAFPNKHANATIDLNCGMTLRDYFAAKVMQAIVKDTDLVAIPTIAYDLAEMMLEERAKRGDK